MAERHGVGVAQLGIRYCPQMGLLPLPKTATPSHLRSNVEVDWMISDENTASSKGIQDGADAGESGAFPLFGKPRR